MAMTSRARTNGMKAFKTVKQVLTKTGWQPELTDAEGQLRVDFSGKLPISEALAEVRIDYERFLFYLKFRERAPVRARKPVMEAVTRANFGLVIGNFELDLDSGALRFKASIDFTEAELTAVLVRDSIRSAMDAVERYAHALVSVMRGESTPAEAIRAAES